MARRREVRRIVSTSLGVRDVAVAGERAGSSLWTGVGSASVVEARVSAIEPTSSGVGSLSSSSGAGTSVVELFGTRGARVSSVPLFHKKSSLA